MPRLVARPPSGPWPIGAIATLALVGAGCGSANKRTGTTAAPASTAAPSSSASASAPAAGTGETVSTKHSKLGTILAAGPKRMTVYLFEADKGASSSCSGGCVAVWPPVQTGSAPSAGAGARGAALGVITRADGTKQVTYNGHPLYFYARDGDKADAYGQAVKSFGASWYVLAPSGKKVDTS